MNTARNGNTRLGTTKGIVQCYTWSTKMRWSLITRIMPLDRML